MYFDFEDYRPDTPTMPRGLTRLEGVLLTIIFHLVVLILIIIGPRLPFMQRLAREREQALEAERLRELQKEEENARFVFVQPRVDRPAPKPPPRADLSDLDRQARTVERAPNPTNRLPFSRGNSPERVESPPAMEARRETPPQPQPAPAQPSAQPEANRGLTLPDAQTATNPYAVENPQSSQRPADGVIADAIRNVQKYAQRETFSNPQGGAQEVAPSIQFDTKGVEFGPWLRRFIAQIRRNWFIPYAAMSMRGHVVVTFYVHKDGRITEVGVAGPSPIDAFNRSAQNAILASTPTQPLPPEYPDPQAFFTVTFYFNETPPGGRE